MRKLLMMGGALAVMMSGASQMAMADTDDLTVEAIIVTPLAITCGTTLDFGSMDAGGVGGNVVIDPDGTVNDPAAPFARIGAGTAAGQCTTTGDTTLAYTVTIPDDQVDSGANNMAVIDFTIEDGVNLPGPADVGYSTALVAGAGTLNIGATLVVGAAQAPGAYTGTVVVTALYD